MGARPAGVGRTTFPALLHRGNRTSRSAPGRGFCPGLPPQTQLFHRASRPADLVTLHARTATSDGLLIPESPDEIGIGVDAAVAEEGPEAPHLLAAPAIDVDHQDLRGVRTSQAEDLALGTGDEA